MAHGKSGLTVVELIVALMLLGVGISALVKTFDKIQRGVQRSKNRTVALSLCRELMETLKNRPYALLRPTTQADLDASGYDASYVPAEFGLQAAGLSFDRFNKVVKARVDGSGQVQALPPAGADLGLKSVEVWVEWVEEGQLRRTAMSSLLVNPERTRPAGSIVGTVFKAPGGPGNELSGAKISVVENPSRLDVSGVSGSYAISSTSGVFTVSASKRGYFPASASVAATPDATQDFTLDSRSSGAVSGTAYLRDHLVISQVVAATVTPGGFEAQFVELHNPTTSPIFIGTPLARALKLRYASPHQAQDCPDIELAFISSAAPAGGFYLIANTDTFALHGAAVIADATFTDSAATLCAAVPDGWAPPFGRRILQLDKAGSVVIASTGGVVYDALGWTQGATTPAFCEGACRWLGAGLAAGEQLVRLSCPTAAAYEPYGRAYDTDDNQSDFASAAPMLAAVRAAPDGPWPVLTGTPAAGAVISADDDLSSPTVASATGYFHLAGIASCTVSGGAASWTVVASSRGYGAAVPGVAPVPGLTLALGALALTGSASDGFVTGTVLSGLGGPLVGLTVAIGAQSATTDGSGFYRIVAPAGSGLNVTANPGHADPGHATAISPSFDLPAGQTVSGVDFTLQPIGSVSGFVSTDGTNPLPAALVRADAPPGTIRGTATTDGAGRFRIEDLPSSSLAGVGAYTISVALDSSQAASPPWAAATVAQGAEVWVGSFTVLGALATISGTVSDSGKPISTGVLLLATQVSLGSDPPPWDEALRGGATVYYSAHARSDGSFALPVRISGSPYNVYAWYSRLSGESAATSLKTATQLVPSTTGAYTLSFSWP